MRSGYLYLVNGEMLVVHQEGTGFCEDYLVSGRRIYLSKRTGYCLIGLGKEVSSFINICNYTWQTGDSETSVPDFSGYNFKQWGIV